MRRPMKTSMHRSFSSAPFALSLALSLALISTVVRAQLFAPTIDPDWREAPAPTPPPIRTEGLIPLEMPGSQLRFGIDPASIVIGKDGVVYYVVVAASSSGAVNGMYEGVRCATAEMKLYARHTPGAGWMTLKESEWRPLHAQGLSRHSLLVARNGVCVGQGANQSASQIARDLRAGPENRFRPEAR
ncbi:MAG: hypothetical protein H7255_19960 [Ramlibacter sp.]|nr:hypothetical protein [Ramlibacter sp.]